MTLLRAAKTMKEANFDPSPLFEEIQVSFTPKLLWTDEKMLLQLLHEVDAPQTLRTWIQSNIPEKPLL